MEVISLTQGLNGPGYMYISPPDEGLGKIQVLLILTPPPFLTGIIDPHRCRMQHPLRHFSPHISNGNTPVDIRITAMASTSHVKQPGYPNVDFAKMQQRLVEEADRVMHEKEQQEEAAQVRLELMSDPSGVYTLSCSDTDHSYLCAQHSSQSNLGEDDSERMGRSPDFEPRERGRREREVSNK
jgi:hypothetical protein